MKESDINKGDDIEVIKLILCSGLYPQIAISDEHNFLKVRMSNFMLFLKILMKKITFLVDKRKSVPYEK